MASVIVLYSLIFLVALPVYRRLTVDGGLTFMAAVSGVALMVLSPFSGLWLLASVLAIHLIMGAGEATDRRGVAAGIGSAALATSLILFREVPWVFWIGISYFTLRHIHVLLDWWMQKLERPTLRLLFQYNFFLPVLVAGPIHRVGHFQAALESRDMSDESYWSGAERALAGAFSAVVIGGWLAHRLFLETQDIFLPGFFDEWSASLVYWIGLYFIFSGLTSVALGLALMAGLRLEENFNRPWLARNLIEFWGRWHITLSGWCQDYVFRTFTAFTRLPSLGLILSMLAMGLWHGATAYWVLWGIWQGLGLVLTRLVVRAPMHVPGWLADAVGRLSIVVWLTLARPVIVTLFGVFP